MAEEDWGKMKIGTPPGAQFEILVDGKPRSYRIATSKPLRLRPRVTRPRGPKLKTPKVKTFGITAQAAAHGVQA